MSCKLHNQTTLLDTAEVLIDFCIQCKRKFTYRKNKNGRMDNEQYRKDHKRDFLQKWDKEYEQVYGKK